MSSLGVGGRCVEIETVAGSHRKEGERLGYEE